MKTTAVMLALLVPCNLRAITDQGKNVLIINSYDSEFVWTHDQDEGFIAEVRKQHPNTHFFIEYMDAKRVNARRYSDELLNLLTRKYEGKDISVIYATDDIALEFTQAHAKEMKMGQAPIVASGINNINNLNRDLHTSTVGIHEVQSAKALVELALKQNPNTKHILIVCDRTDVGQDIANDIDEQARTITDLPIERLTDLKWADTLDYIGRFDRDTLFLLGLYSVDKEGEYIQPALVATEVAKKAQGPTYAFHDIFTVSPEVVGGYVNSGLNQGRISGTIANRLLNGEKLIRESEIEHPGFQWEFNYGALKRFGISTSTLPAGSQINGAPENFFAQHPVLVISVLLGITAQTLLIVFLLFNIRRRIAVTKDLVQSEERIRMLLENSPLAIFISDRDGNIILLNSQFKTIFGYNIAEASTIDQIRNLLIPDPEYRNEITEAIRSKQEFAQINGIATPPVEYTARARDGRTVEVEMYCAEVGDMRFRILHDVTERNRVMRELRQATNAAMAANEAKSLFIANVSHEIRTPMNGILGMVQLMHETPLTAEQRDHLDTIGDSCSLLLTVINDILDLSRIEAGQMKLRQEPVKLDNFLKSVASIAASAVNAKDLEFICDFAHDLPDTILCDPNRVKQVLLNLLINASKFTEKGLVEFIVAAEYQSPSKCRMRFTVRDTGLGIPLETQARLFEPFMQGDSSHTRRIGGSGLGLAISRKLAHMMGGQLSVKSAPGVGSSFTFEIPVEIVPPAPEPTQNLEHLDSNAAHSHPLSILVAEDNAVNQKVVNLMLRKMGYVCDVVTNGQSAVDAAKEKNYDVILMDLQMPLMDGIRATQIIRTTLPEDRQPHIYALTAHAMSDDEKRSLDAGMNGHLTKPLRVVELREALIHAYDEIHATKNS